jgi:hypothetical protein
VLAACAIPDLPPDAGILFDRRGYVPPATARVHAIAELLTPHAALLRRRRIAIIVGDRTSYGMSRMFDNLLELQGIRVAVFEAAADAERWLRDPNPP